MSTIDLADREGEHLDVNGARSHCGDRRALADAAVLAPAAQDKVAMVALVFIVLLVLVAVFAPLIVKLVGARPPNEQATKYLDSLRHAHRAELGQPRSASTRSAATSSAACSTARASR